MAPIKIVPGPYDDASQGSQVGSVLDPAVRGDDKKTGGQQVTMTTTSVSNTSCHDTMRYGPRSMANEIKAGHPLEKRLARWAETQETAKLEMHRRIYGVGVPARTVLERQVCGASTSHPAIPSSSTYSNFSMDILLGVDNTLTPADVFRYANGGVAAPHHSHETGSDDRYNDISAEIERSYGIKR